MSRPERAGLLFIGDPHLASRVPGFRRDDYPRVALEKLMFCLDVARAEDLEPILLGDLFHWPRENANWLLAELLSRLPAGLLSITGNHDCHENKLTPHDSLSLLVGAGRLRLLDGAPPWRARVGGHKVSVRGLAWDEPIPELSDGEPDPDELVIWLTHHDVAFSGPILPGRPAPFEVAGVDLVINGHIHNEELAQRRGQTLWVNPGNIARLSRDGLTRAHQPAALRLEMAGPRAFRLSRAPIPCAPFDEVFHPAEEARADAPWLDPSAFVSGLGELAARRTQSGEGLTQFLDLHLHRLAPPLASAITDLAKEVLPHDHPWRRARAGHAGAQAPLRGAAQEEDPG